MIAVSQSSVGLEELAAVEGCLSRQWMGLGQTVREFEAAFMVRLGLPSFQMTNSGSSALQRAVELLQIPRGSEIILPSYTWFTCAQAVVLNGCVPVFCDVDLATQNVTRETIDPHITSKTAAIMVVHYAGLPVDLAPILALGFPVIEDAAHAVDSRIDGRACGSMGTIGCYSFDAVKNLATPDGGGITSSDPAVIHRMLEWSYSGVRSTGHTAAGLGASRWWETAITAVTPRFQPNGVSAAIGLAQLGKFDRLQARRKAIWTQYQDAFADLAWLVLPVGPAPHQQHSYFTYSVRVLGGARDTFARVLYGKGIYTTLRFPPLHRQAIYGSSARLPMTEQLAEEALSLPLHPNLSEADVQAVIDAVRRFRPETVLVDTVRTLASKK